MTNENNNYLKMLYNKYIFKNLSYFTSIWVSTLIIYVGSSINSIKSLNHSKLHSSTYKILKSSELFGYPSVMA